MAKTDKEVLELCKSWFEDIMERSDRLTSGNVSHCSRAIHGVAKNYAEFIGEHLENRWKPSEEQIQSLSRATNRCVSVDDAKILLTLLSDIEQLKAL